MYTFSGGKKNLFLCLPFPKSVPRNRIMPSYLILVTYRLTSPVMRLRGGLPFVCGSYEEKSSELWNGGGLSTVPLQVLGLPEMDPWHVMLRRHVAIYQAGEGPWRETLGVKSGMDGASLERLGRTYGLSVVSANKQFWKENNGKGFYFQSGIRISKWQWCQSDIWVKSNIRIFFYVFISLGLHILGSFFFQLLL